MLLHLITDAIKFLRDHVSEILGVDIYIAAINLNASIGTLSVTEHLVYFSSKLFTPNLRSRNFAMRGTSLLVINCTRVVYMRVATLSPILSMVISAGKFGCALCWRGLSLLQIVRLKISHTPVTDITDTEFPRHAHTSTISPPSSPFRAAALRLVSVYLATIPGACVTAFQLCRRKRVRRQRFGTPD